MANLIPSPEDFGATLQRPDILERCAIIMKVINDPARIKEEARAIAKEALKPSPFMKYFPEIAKF